MNAGVISGWTTRGSVRLQPAKYAKSWYVLVLQPLAIATCLQGPFSAVLYI
jgi:hypothetical protein